MRVKNVSGVAREIVTPDDRSINVEDGEVFEVDDDLGKSLLEQPDNWGPAGSGKSLDELTQKELVELAAARGVEVNKSDSKAEIIAAINKGS